MSEYFYVKIGGYNRKEQIQQQIQELKPCLKDWETRKVCFVLCQDPN